MRTHAEILWRHLGSQSTMARETFPGWGQVSDLAVIGYYGGEVGYERFPRAWVCRPKFMCGKLNPLVLMLMAFENRTF